MMNRLNIAKLEKYLMTIIKIYHEDTWRLLLLSCSSLFSGVIKHSFQKHSLGEGRAYFTLLITAFHWGNLRAGTQAGTTEEHCLPAHAWLSVQGIGLPAVGLALLNELSIKTIHHRPIWSGNPSSVPSQMSLGCVSSWQLKLTRTSYPLFWWQPQF